MTASTRPDLSEELFFEPEFLKGKKNSELSLLKDKLRASSANILYEKEFSLVKERLSYLKTEFAGMETDPIALAVGVDQKEFQAFILAAALCYNQICLEEIDRCQSAKATAVKKGVYLETLSAPGWPTGIWGKANLATKVESIQIGLFLPCWMQERGQLHLNEPALMHKLDYDLEWRGLHIRHRGRQASLDTSKKILKQQQRRMAIKRWIVTTLAVVAGIALGAMIGMAVGFAVGAIGGPVTAIVCGLLGVIGGAVAGGLAYSVNKPAKSYEYLSTMLDHGKKAYVMQNGKDKISEDYLIGELVKSERGRRIIHSKFPYNSLSESDESSESDNSSALEKPSGLEKSSKSRLFEKSNSAIIESAPDPSNINNKLNTPKK